MGGGLKMLELFAGIGGFRRGFESAGHTCVGWVERDKFARRSYKAIWPSAEEEWNREDISSVTDDDLRRLPRDVGGVDVLAFGFPCQAFSIAGKRGGFADTRGTLVYDALRFASVLRCPILIAENVVGLLNDDGGRTFHTILCAMDGLGYDVEWQVCNTTEVGVPQNRDRVFIVGHLRGSGSRKVFPLRFDGSQGSGELKELASAGAKTGLYRVETDVSKTIRAGGRGSFDGRHTWDLVQVGVVRKVVDGEARYSEREVSLCIDANYFKGLDAHQERTGVAVRAAHTPTRIRRLTPLECWRLFGRADWEYQRAKDAGLSDSQLYRQAGNSLAPQIVEAIARRLSLSGKTRANSKLACANQALTHAHRNV